LKFALHLRDELSRLARSVNRIRAVRKQLKDRNELLKNDPRAEPLIEQSEEFIRKLDKLEGKLHNPKAQVYYDILAQRGGAQLYSKISALYEWSKDSDGLPTQGMRDVADEESRELNQLEDQVHRLLGADLAKLNGTAREMDIPGVFVPVEAERDKKPSEK